MGEGIIDILHALLLDRTIHFSSVLSVEQPLCLQPRCIKACLLDGPEWEFKNLCPATAISGSARAEREQADTAHCVQLHRRDVK